jgi:hypothetical protein
MESLNETSKSVVHQFHEDPQPRLKVVRFYYFEYTLVLFAHAHHADFVYDNLALGLVLRLHKFEGAQVSIRLSFDLKNLREAALSQFTNYIVELTRVHSLDLAVFLYLRLKLLFGWQLLD